MKVATFWLVALCCVVLAYFSCAEISTAWAQTDGRDSSRSRKRRKRPPKKRRTKKPKSMTRPVCHPQNKKKAQELYAQGQKLANKERYEEAAHSYERANELCKRPGLLFHAAEMHRFAGNYIAALTRYQEYLDIEPYGEGSGAAHEHLAAGNLKLLRQLWKASKTELASVGRGADTRALEQRIVALAALLGQSKPTKRLIPRRTVLGAVFTDRYNWHRDTWPLWTVVSVGAVSLTAGGLLYLEARELAGTNTPFPMPDLDTSIRNRKYAAWSTAGVGTLLILYGSLRLFSKRRRGRVRPRAPGVKPRIDATFAPHLTPRSFGGAIGLKF